MHGGLKVYRGSPAAARSYVEAGRGRADDYYLAEGTISNVLQTVPYVNLPADVLAATRTTWEASK